MSFSGTYAHTFLIALDQTGAAVLFNRNDATISSLCHLQLETDAGNADAAAKHATLNLHPWQVWFLRHVGAGLEWKWPGHCARAAAADIARAESTKAILS